MIKLIQLAGRNEGIGTIVGGYYALEDYCTLILSLLPAKGGPSAGEAYDGSEFERLLNLYYRKRGWNEEGWPEAGKLRELGIE